MRKKLKLTGVMMVAVLLTAAMVLSQVIAYAGTVERKGTEVTSPLYQVRVDQAAQTFAETPNILTETAGGKIGGGPVQALVISGTLSACIGSACLLSGCLGSACKWSGCFGSACMTSGCGGSACVVSGCGSSACVLSGCGASLCVLSGCAFSVCLNCPIR